LGRDDHNNKLNNKNGLAQTPKNMKIAPNRIKEEIASEFAEIGEKALKGISKTTQYLTKARFPKN